MKAIGIIITAIVVTTIGFIFLFVGKEWLEKEEKFEGPLIDDSEKQKKLKREAEEKNLGI